MGSGNTKPITVLSLVSGNDDAEVSFHSSLDLLNMLKRVSTPLSYEEGELIYATILSRLKTDADAVDAHTTQRQRGPNTIHSSLHALNLLLTKHTFSSKKVQIIHEIYMKYQRIALDVDDDWLRFLVTSGLRDLSQVQIFEPSSSELDPASASPTVKLEAIKSLSISIDDSVLNLEGEAADGVEWLKEERRIDLGSHLNEPQHAFTDTPPHE